MKSIGGFFSLELPINSKGELYPTAIKLNSGRACLEYVLRLHNYSKIYLPFYTCQVVLDTIQKVGMEYEFYHVNTCLEIANPINIGHNEVLLYTNYFGLKDDYIIKLSKKFHNFILDNSQAFFFKPIEGFDSFNTCRKFFGVADGAYLFTTLNSKLDIPQGFSSNRMNFLLDRLDKSPEEAFSEFHDSEKLIDCGCMTKMSKITQAIMSSIDYETIAKRRFNNFTRLHQQLGNVNELSCTLKKGEVPMVYPFLMKNNDILRAKLIAHRVYVAKYWPNVEEWAGKETYDAYLANNLLPLPIDQRYDNTDMDYILKLINSI